MERPLVSVIVPVYNGERFLEETLDSIFSQDYHPFEVIVVDDGSVDATAKIAQSFADVRYVYQNNRGPGAARNTGITAAQGEFLAFLDADDKWTPNKLSRQVEYMLEQPKVGYTICRMHVFLEPGTDWPEELNKEHYQNDPPAYSPCALLVRKYVIDQIGNFDPTYRHGNDSDWFFRARDAGIAMAIIPEVLLHRRFHGSNLSYETRAVNQELLRVIRLSVRRKHQQPRA